MLLFLLLLLKIIVMPKQNKPHQDERLQYRIATQSCIRQTYTRLNFDYVSSDHCHGSGFHNHAPRPEHLTATNILKWVSRRYKTKAKWTAQANALSNLMLEPRAHVGLQDWKAYFVGHATVLLQIGKYNFLTDPVWCDYVSPQQGSGPKRFRPMGLALEQLPKIDAVLLSHNHYDHMDLATLNWLVAHFDMPIFTGLANGCYLPKHFRVIELDWWQEQYFGDNQELSIVYVPSQHGSGRGIRDQNQALWGGFSVLSDYGHAYFAGDAGYSAYFSEIRARLGAPRLSLLPIGAYEPRHLMQYLHMNPEDAVRAHLDLQSQLSMAVHHRMFQLTDESMLAPEQDLRVVLQQYAVDSTSFVCLDEGQSITC